MVKLKEKIKLKVSSWLASTTSFVKAAIRKVPGFRGSANANANANAKAKAKAKANVDANSNSNAGGGSGSGSGSTGGSNETGHEMGTSNDDDTSALFAPPPPAKEPEYDESYPDKDMWGRRFEDSKYVFRTLPVVMATQQLACTCLYSKCHRVC